MSKVHTEATFEAAIVRRPRRARRLDRRATRRTSTGSSPWSRRTSSPSSKRRSRSCGPSCASSTATGWKSALLDTVVKTLDVARHARLLRHGFKFYGKKIDLAYFKPAHGLNPELEARYAQNRLMVTRQVKFIAEREDCHRPGAVRQRPAGGDRGAEEPVHRPDGRSTPSASTCATATRASRSSRFKKRALVHFAVDPDVVSMTTRLAGELDRLPALQPGQRRRRQRGRRRQPGEPERLPHGLPVGGGLAARQLPRHPRPLRPPGSDEDGRERRQDGREGDDDLPRYHQLDAVRKLEAAARGEGAGHNYLVQHSAGSGKSNSIAWLAHRLASLHDADDQQGLRFGGRRHRPPRARPAAAGHHLPVRAQAGRRAEDRRALRPARRGAGHRHADHHHDAAEVPLRHREDRRAAASARYAVIVDEAHSSQARRGGAADEAGAGGAASLEEAEQEDAEPEEPTYEDEILRGHGSRAGRSRTSASSPSPRRRSSRRWRSSAAGAETASRTRSTSTRCARRSRRASSSMC